MNSKKKKNFLLAALSFVMILCVVLASALLSNAKVLAGEKDAYKYTLAFSDDFDDGNIDGWSVVRGGSSYAYAKDGANKNGWRFNGTNHIVYKQGGESTDYGKFLYGTENSTDYVFEVKMRADVDETLNEYMDKYSANLGGNLTLNTHLPFFVTDYAPNASYHTFIGRSVCISNYAIGFYEYTYKDQDEGTLRGAWAKKSATDAGSASVRIKNTFGDGFDWREWHTIRVEATATACKLYLDGALMVTAENGGFTLATETRGYAGFAGVCTEKYKPLHFDDFRFWTKNATYDSALKTETAVNSINAADFRDSKKAKIASSAPSAALEATAENKLLYNPEVLMGTDQRVLTDYSYTSLRAVVGMDIERQKAAKGVVAGETYTGTTRISTSNVTGILFNGSFTGGKYNGYQLCYYAIYYQGSFQNVVNLYLNKLTDSALKSTSTDQILIGKLTGTTSCVVDMNVEGGYLTVTPYASKADHQSGNKATLKNSASSVTVTDGAYKVKLPTYDAAKGGDYSEGNFGFRCQSGSDSKQNLQLMCDVEFISFSGKALVAPPATEPLASETATKTVSVGTVANGAVTINGAATNKAQTVAAHGEVKLTFTPASGYIVDNVTINGVKMGAITEFTLSNVTSDYTVEVVFSNVKKVDVYLLAGQSNAAGFTPVNGLYKGYTYGGEVDEEKLSAYEAGYTDIMYYGVTQSADPENAGAKWNYVTVGKGANASRIGPELGFADFMSGYYGGTNGKAAVVKYAVGSTGFGNAAGTVRNTYGNWMSPSAIAAAKNAGEVLHEKAGLMYNNLLKTFTLALQELIAQGYEPEIKGAMWLQGCDDAVLPQASKYQQNLTCLIGDLRADVAKVLNGFSLEQDCSNMPFVICKIGAELQNASAEDVVREQMQMTAAAITNVRIVETDDFVLPDANDNNDVWHFSVKGILAIGNRFADILLQMNGKKAVVNYSVTFDADGGTGTFAPQTVAQYMSAAAPESDPEKAGFTFLGWFEENSETAWSFTANAVKGNVELKAKWSAIDYTITFRLDGGSFALGIEAKETYTAADEAYSLPVPVKAGYSFNGWYENADFSGEAVETLALGSTGNKVYHAKWTKESVKYTVTVVAPENGTLEASVQGSVEAGTEITVTATPAAGYKLVKITVNGVEFKDEKFLLGENVTIAAEFERDTLLYAITVTQGANGTISVDKTYAGENDIVTVTVTPNKGYELVSVKVNGTAIDGTSFVVTGETAVTAEFAKVEKKADKGCGGVSSLGCLTAALVCAGAALDKKRKK